MVLGFWILLSKKIVKLRRGDQSSDESVIIVVSALSDSPPTA
jgi:hypothetical protein